MQVSWGATNGPGPPLKAAAPTATVDAELEPDICWQAVRSRDPRFDGRFFVGATTTRVYCRSVCPVPFAKPNNIVLFPCAAAAEAAGFRPCRRCRPETAPGTPAWAGTSTVVARALRLIWDGALDAGSVEQLAEQVGIGSRQLRRLFVQHLGVAPIKIASTHRLHFARSLIEQTGMPMAEIALNSGFKSIRQFNHALQTTVGQSPTELRRLRGNLPVSSRRGVPTVRLSYRPPFHWPALMHFLELRATPGVEVVTTDSYQRTINSEAGAGIIEVMPDPKAACLNVRIALPKYSGLLRVVQRVRRVFDLEADPLHIEAHLSRDHRLKPLSERRPGLRVPGVWDAFEVAVRAALGQRLIAMDSNEVAGQLVEKFGRRIRSSVDGLTHLFPRPEDLAYADLALAGVSRESAVSIWALARGLCNRQLDLESSRTLQDTISRLHAIDGMSQEMAHYIAMRAFGETDAFPLEGALTRWLSPDESPTSERTLSIAENWRPWRAYAAMHIWADRAAP
jgi:AraC family transcriptional regulator of adaptative response / DNA-3-methyladenine glycosylase II